MTHYKYLDGAVVDDEDFLLHAAREFPNLQLGFVEIMAEHIRGMRAEAAVLRARLAYVTAQRDAAECIVKVRPRPGAPS